MITLRKEADNLLREVLDKALDNKLSNPVESDKKTVYLYAIELARDLFRTGKLERLRFDPPDEPLEVHIMQLFVCDTGDLDGSEVKIFAKLLSCFDYVTFEVQEESDNQIMIACMINDVYVES